MICCSILLLALNLTVKDLDTLMQWAHTWEMEFNYQKCEFLRVTSKQYSVIHNYHMDSIPIRQVSHTKYLGVTIANNLSWNKHIQTITNKARQFNNFLYRNLRQCPSHTKCSCYKIMVHPIIEYVGSVWDPHTLSNINKLESIQRRAARVCYNDFLRFLSVTDMLSSLNLPLL